MKKVGLRHLMKYRSSTDTFGNGMLIVCFIFCTIYWLIPFYSLFYTLLLVFCVLATMGRVCMLPKRQRTNMPVWVAFCLYAIGATGWFCSMFNVGHDAILSFRADVLAGKVHEFFYIMTHVSFMHTLLQGFIMWIPFWILWNHFKYMRCEKRIRAKNVATLTVKSIFVCLILIVLYVYGFNFLNVVYHVY